MKSLVFAALACALTVTGCCRPAHAQDTPPSPEELARELAAEVLREAGGAGLGDWTRDAIGRALERAGRAASGTAAGAGSGEDPETSPAPLPAERHAGEIGEEFPARANTAEVIVLMSLSVPAAGWGQWAREAARVGAPLVMRGVAEDGLRKTVKRVGARLGSAAAGVAIDPRLFRLFGIERVPAVVVVPGGVPPCASRGCADPGSGSGAGFPAPPHDLVAGNIGLAAALEAVADEGDAARDVARRHLERLRREDGP